MAKKETILNTEALERSSFYGGKKEVYTQKTAVIAYLAPSRKERLLNTETLDQGYFLHRENGSNNSVEGSLQERNTVKHRESFCQKENQRQ